ncbi:hypothetical protein uan_114 [Pseudomonas phage UAntarctica]|nr:hypothetical protein uan_114 [Pseudomonas phage UAntarctica]
MRMSRLEEEVERQEFAKTAAKHFAENPNHWTYAKGNPTPGEWLALRWGGGNDCVVVLRVSATDPIVNYQEIIREYLP